MEKFNALELVVKICNELNEMETREFGNNEKIVAVYELVKNDIKYIATMRSEFFCCFSEMVEQKCSEQINNEYGFYEGLIVALCGGNI